MATFAVGQVDSRVEKPGRLSEWSHGILSHGGNGLLFAAQAVRFSHPAPCCSLRLVDRLFGLPLLVGPSDRVDHSGSHNLGHFLERCQRRANTIPVFNGKGFSDGGEGRLNPHIRCGQSIPMRPSPWARTREVSSQRASREARSEPSDLRTGQAS